MKGYIQNYLNAKYTRQANANEAERLRDSAQAIDDEELLLKMAEAIEGLRGHTEALAVRVDALEGGPLVPRATD